MFKTSKVSSGKPYGWMGVYLSEVLFRDLQQSCSYAERMRSGIFSYLVLEDPS